MSESHTARDASMTTQDRQMLAGAYWPIIAFAAVLVTARIAHRHRYRRETAVAGDRNG